MPDLPPLLAEIHYRLPRQGPGDDASTARAFGLLGLKKDSLRVLDIGCGPGAQTLALARLTNGTVTALDDSPALLGELGSRIDGALTQGRIKPVLGSMFDLPFEHRTFDLIWSEGAIYIIGFEAGLKSWRPLLKDGGAIGVTHISWLKRDMPEEPRRFWNAAYPAITSMENNLAILAASGFAPAGHFVLPQAAWWTDYYTPLQARLAELRQTYAGDAAALAVIAESQREIDLYRAYPDCYGYVFYTARKA